MKFRLVEEQLTESNNTNLRSFLIGLVALAGIKIDVKNLVVHHTERNTKINDLDKLVLMYDSDHRSMHAKYRGSRWKNDAHDSYFHIPVQKLIELAVNALKETSKQDEISLEKNMDQAAANDPQPVG